MLAGKIRKREIVPQLKGDGDNVNNCMNQLTITKSQK